MCSESEVSIMSVATQLNERPGKEVATKGPSTVSHRTFPLYSIVPNAASALAWLVPGFSCAIADHATTYYYNTTAGDR